MGLDTRERRMRLVNKYICVRARDIPHLARDRRVVIARLDSICFRCAARRAFENIGFEVYTYTSLIFGVHVLPEFGVNTHKHDRTYYLVYAMIIARSHHAQRHTRAFMASWCRRDCRAAPVSSSRLRVDWNMGMQRWPGSGARATKGGIGASDELICMAEIFEKPSGDRASSRRRAYVMCIRWSRCARCWCCGAAARLLIGFGEAIYVYFIGSLLCFIDIYVYT